MAITLRYNPAYANVMGVAQDTGEGDLLRQLNEIARRDQMEAARLDEQARQFDLGLAANQQNQASQRGFQYASLGANVAQNQAAMQQRAMEQQSLIDARMAEQQMQGEQMLAGQQMQNQRAFVGEQARVAREAANRRFEKSMKDREVLLDQFQRGMLTPQQEQQAIASWEEAAGMDWGMPDEMAAQDEGQAMQERVAAIESTFFTHPITKEPLVSEGAVAKMLEMGMDIKDITSQGLDLQANAMKTEAMKAKEGEADRKIEEKKVASSQDVYKYGQQAMGDYQQAQADHVAKVAEYNAEKEAHQLALEEFEQARKEWQAQPAPAEGKPKKPFSGKRPSFTKVPPVAPLPMQFAGSTGFPVARSAMEVQQKLESGEWADGTPFLTPDGQMKIARIRQQ